MADQPLLIALAAVQFFVHAAGWAMAANLTQHWRGSEGQFAVFWLLLSMGLLLYVPAWPSGSLPRNLGDVLIIAANVIQHRGMARYWGRKTSLVGEIALLVVTVAAVLLSLFVQNGHGIRVATVCAGVGVLLLLMARLAWLYGRQAGPLFATVLAIGYGVLATALLARAMQALIVGASTKISIDAAGHSNVPLAILVMFVGGMINLAQIRLLLGRVLQHLTREAQTDALTGVVNRRGLMQRLDEVHLRARRAACGYVVLMVDIDHFKAINDELGHVEGDRVLQRVAQSLHGGLRSGDIVARWGGEEFVLLLPGMQLGEATALAERLRALVMASGEPVVTISIGVAEAVAATEDSAETIRRADAALYRAKAAGRNRVMTAAEHVSGRMAALGGRAA